MLFMEKGLCIQTPQPVLLFKHFSKVNFPAGVTLLAQVSQWAICIAAGEPQEKGSQVTPFLLQPHSIATRTPYFPWGSQAICRLHSRLNPSFLSPILRTVNHSLEKTTPASKAPLSTFTLDKSYRNPEQLCANRLTF